jgi:2-phospho-L-lactate/phosphoenolpyruvate guanylyltransferase
VRTQAIVPIKSFTSAKQRLADVLAAGSRRSLVQAMFSDVLASLRRCESVDRIVVVTADPLADSIARVDRVEVLDDDASAGQSAATEIGIADAVANGFDRVLLVPGDTPLLDPPEIDDLLERTANDGLEVAIIPDRHGTGTNALVLAPPDAIRPSFGEGSFERHMAAARDAGRNHRAEAVSSLAPDVDTADDLAVVWNLVDGARVRAQRTRGALSQLERSGARAALAGARASRAVEV